MFLMIATAGTGVSVVVAIDKRLRLFVCVLSLCFVNQGFVRSRAQQGTSKLNDSKVQRQ